KVVSILYTDLRFLRLGSVDRLDYLFDCSSKLFLLLCHIFLGNTTEFPRKFRKPQRHKKGLSAAGKGCGYIFYPTRKLKTRTPEEGRPCLRPRRKVKPMSPEPSVTYVSERTPVRILRNGPAHACAALDGFNPVRTRPPIGAVVKLTDLRGILQYIP